MAEQLTYKKVLELFKETDAKFKETDAKFKETDAKFKETDAKFKETDAKFKETAKRLEDERKKSQKEFDKKLGKITSLIGDFVESLVEPKLLELFKERGILLTDIMHNVIITREGIHIAEIDLLLVNASVSVAVEAKTTLNVDGVKEHIERLNTLQKNPPSYIRNKILFGAVAGIRIEGEADKYAYRNGLFVLRQSGEIVEIANDDKFEPKEWIIE